VNVRIFRLVPYSVPGRGVELGVITSIYARLVAMLIIGLAIRLGFAPLSAGFGWDMDGMRLRAIRLTTAPWAAFYDVQQDVADHLPGDLWIMWVIASGYRMFSADSGFQNYSFALLVKLVPAAADLGIGLVLFLLGRRLASPSAGLLAAAAFLLNPASIFLTSLWGQWDPVSAFLMSVALWLLLRGSLVWSFPVLTYAALIKPQLALMAPLFALALLHQYVLPHFGWARCRSVGSAAEPLARFVHRAIAALAASAFVALAVPLPFDVGIPPLGARWSLFDRLGYSSNAHPWAWLNQFSLWALWAPYPEKWIPDNLPSVFGLTYRAWGYSFLAIAYAVILWYYWRRGSDRALLWAVLATAFSLFMLPTRMHSRYLLPAIPCLALAAAIAPRLRWLYVALSVTFLANLVWNALIYSSWPMHDALHRSTLYVHLTALTNVVLFIYVMFRSLPILNNESEAPAQPDQRVGPSSPSY
jgi:dolichyl-phosphate-mannose-protein mannosyltransferase